jgi:PAS domain S-box-containing protein
MSIDLDGMTVEEPWAPISGRLHRPHHDVFRSFFERSGLCLAHLDRSLRIVEANDDFFRQFGRARSEVRGRNFCELLHPSVRDKLGQQLARLAGNQQARVAERVVASRSDGARLAGELTAFVVSGRTGTARSVMVLVRPETASTCSQLLARRSRMLTKMDARILEGVAAGVSTVQLASMLYLSRGGVEYHVASLLRTMKVKNRPALVSKAFSMGIFGVGSWPPRVRPEFVK